ncbi:MAG TPA: hypothetical protein VM580_06610 [Labilithrix sp.]|nr:hypothetical protein [Labilithrix sp.]
MRFSPVRSFLRPCFLALGVFAMACGETPGDLSQDNGIDDATDNPSTTHGADNVLDGGTNDGTEELSGELTVYAEEADDANSQSYFLETEKGSVALRLDNVDTGPLETGQRLKVQGTWNDEGAFVASSVTVQGTSTLAAGARANGVNGRLCVVLVTYTNDRDYYNRGNLGQNIRNTFQQATAIIRDVTRNRYNLTSIQFETKAAGIRAPAKHSLRAPLPLNALAASSTLAPRNASSCTHRAWVLPTYADRLDWFALGIATVGGGNISSYVGHSVSLISVMHELGHNFGLRHSADDRVDPMGGVNHSHYNALNMMSLGFKFNVRNLNNLNRGSSASIDLRPVETNLDAAEREGVYLYGTDLRHARTERGALPGTSIPLPLPTGTLSPVLVRRESNGETRFLAAGDPANRNWRFTYGDTTYAWHPTVANRVVVTRRR